VYKRKQEAQNKDKKLRHYNNPGYTNQRKPKWIKKP